jgi:transcriptional regulator of arginine metabolism
MSRSQVDIKWNFRPLRHRFVLGYAVGCINMKGYRHGVILEVIEQESISSQEQLRQRLHERHIDVTQATLSRDLKELGLVKRAADGAYQRPGIAQALDRPGALPALQRRVGEFLTRADRVDQLVVLRTDAGQAQMLALAIDRAPVAEVVGTIAGDDTILVICRDSVQAAAFLARLQAWRAMGAGRQEVS